MIEYFVKENFEVQFYTSENSYVSNK